MNPTRTAEFMEGLTEDEAWAVLQRPMSATSGDLQYSITTARSNCSASRTPIRAELIAELYSDDRVDLLQEMDQERVDLLLELLPRSDRRDIQRLQAYPEGTAGSLMTTEMAKLAEQLTVREALDALSRLGEQLETIYYIYVVDEEEKLRGVVSGRQLIASLGRSQTKLADLMETDVLTALATEDQESVAKKVERLDLLAIPVIDESGKLVGIITHDDVIDVVREELIEDAQRIGGITPLREEYLKINLFLLGWKRGAWLTILFFTALLTAFALRHYEDALERYAWVVLFLPLIVSTGGNSGNQAATLVITALTGGELTVRDWLKVLVREWLVGMLLGSVLAVIGFMVAWRFAPSAHQALVIPLTLMLVVTMGCRPVRCCPDLRRLGSTRP